MSRTERRLLSDTPAVRAAAAKRRNLVLAIAVAVPAILILVAIVLFNNRQVQSASVAPEISALKVGVKAPEFSVSTTSGLFDLAKSGHKPTLVEVFATWCPHCQRETAVLDKIAAKYGSTINLVAVAGSERDITQNGPETQADVIAFADQFKVTYPIAFDPNLDVAHKYLGTGFPTVVLVGSDGIVQSIRDGEIPQADLASALDAAIAGKKPDPKMGSKA